VIDHFGPLARFYDRLVPLPDPGRLVAQLALPAPGPLLDAGGGTGRIGRLLAGRAQRRVVCDLSHGMLRQALRRGERLAVRGRCEALPFAGGRFARALVIDALHHFTDIPLALSELARVLAPGGRLLVEEPDIRRPLIRILAWLERAAAMGSRFYPAPLLVRHLSRAGMTAGMETGSRFSVWIWAQKTDLDRHPAAGRCAPLPKRGGPSRGGATCSEEPTP
jgi:demethylmenaquinone methyltransferase/2-methoxy-6-polyprenyl-1,4-benzoquinol methylase